MRSLAVRSALLLIGVAGPALAQEAPAEAPAEARPAEEAPAEAPPAEPVGLLKVTGTIDGAAVHLDYVEVGVTPLMDYFPVGDHTVRVSIDGYQPFVRKVSLNENATTNVDAFLVSGSGSVEFFVRPMGARVEIDGRDVGVAPIRLTDVPEGSHGYRLSADRHEPTDGSFEYRRGQNVLVVHDLESSAGRWRVDSNPDGADAWLDDEYIGQTPIHLSDVPGGVHLVRLEKGGHATALRTVDTTDGSRGDVRAKLADTYARQSFKAGEAGARYSADGHSLGEGAKIGTRLERGDYLLRVEADGFQTLNTEIEVPLGGFQGWRVTLAPEGSGEGSTIEPYTPLVRRWTFWTAVGVVAGGGAIAAAIASSPPEPEEQPSGDVAVTRP